MINFSGLNANSRIGKILRKILKLTPKGFVFPILQGPAKGMKWIVGSSNHGCWLGSYELKKQKQIVKYLKPCMVVYDIVSLHGPEVARECSDFIRRYNYKIYNLDGGLIRNYDDELPDEIVALPSSL